MKSIQISPNDKKEFDKAFSLLIEFGKERKRLTLDDDDDISFAFLMKTRDVITEAQEKEKVTTKKPSR